MDGLDPNGRVPVRIKVLCYEKERTCRVGCHLSVKQCGHGLAPFLACSAAASRLHLLGRRGLLASAAPRRRRGRSSKFRHVMSPDFLDARWVWVASGETKQAVGTSSPFVCLICWLLRYAARV